MITQKVRELYAELGNHLKTEQSDVEPPEKIAFGAALDNLLVQAVVSDGMKTWVRNRLMVNWEAAYDLEDVVLYFHNQNTEAAPSDDFAMFEPGEQPVYERLRLENALAEFFSDCTSSIVGLTLPKWVEVDGISWKKAADLLMILLDPGEEEIPRAANDMFFNSGGLDRKWFEAEIELLSNWISEFGELANDPRFEVVLPVFKKILKLL